ncbi:MAG: 2-dehydropantoate 2-reductase [Pseudomonadota bacterium]
MRTGKDPDGLCPPWYILGAGALGTLIAGQLQAQEKPFILLSRDRADRHRRLNLGDRWLDLSLQPIAELQQGVIQGLIVATKAGDCSNAIAQVSDGLAAEAEVLVMANGLGFEPELASVVDSSRLLRGVSTAAAYRQGSEEVITASHGETYVGRMGQNGNSEDHHKPPSLFLSSSLCQLKTWSWEAEIERRIHRKFCINCVVNPLSAFLRCKNGMLVEHPDYRTQTQDLASEVEEVARELGLWSGEETLMSAVVAVCQSTSDNLSSTLQDVLAGRKSELPFLSGELHKRAERKGIETPQSVCLLDKLLG